MSGRLGVGPGPVTVCLFARVPRLGQVKRRLAHAIGARAALAAHCRLVEDSLSRLARIPGGRCELWLDRPPDARCRAWSKRFAVPLRRQQGADLGVRMAHALESALGRSARALLVGSDCPPIDARYLAEAAAALGDHDVVLGPTRDGGYGLIGMTRPVPALFQGIEWGSARVLRQTLAAAAAAGCRVALLRQIWDVDTVADWVRYRQAAQFGWETRARD